MSGTLSSKSTELQTLRERLGDCQRCELCRRRTHVVFGEGNPNARVMFVGAAPGRDSDLSGEPFYGGSGELFDRMIRAMGLSRTEIYVTNIVKCRPPNNRDPLPDEVQACEPFLKEQIRIVRPDAIVTLGRFATQSLLRRSEPIDELRGRWHAYGDRPAMPTLDFTTKLSNQQMIYAWQNMSAVLRHLRMPVPHENDLAAVQLLGLADWGPIVLMRWSSDRRIAG